MEFGKLVVVSYNKGKICEINELLVFYGFDVVLVGDFDFLELEEIGIIFEVNVEIKVVVLVFVVGFLVFVDDSGFCVVVLGGDLGIYFVCWVGLDKDFVMVMCMIEEKL